MLASFTFLGFEVVGHIYFVVLVAEAPVPLSACDAGSDEIPRAFFALASVRFEHGDSIRALAMSCSWMVNGGFSSCFGMDFRVVWPGSAAVSRWAAIGLLFP
jgi:hypothetical protein